MIAVPRTEPRQISDAEAIRRSLVEPAAFVHVFERHFSVLYKFLTLRVGWEAAEDLAAETFAIAFDRRRDYDVTRLDARAWLFGIALNLGRAHSRRRRRFLAAFERLPRDQYSPDIANEIAAARTAAEPLRRALSGLDETERTLLLLFACAELSYGEIGEALGLPLGTVRSRLHRARAKLRRDLTAELQC